jgi:hypothetical protein
MTNYLPNCANIFKLSSLNPNKDENRFIDNQVSMVSKRQGLFPKLLQVKAFLLSIFFESKFVLWHIHLCFNEWGTSPFVTSLPWLSITEKPEQ